MQLSKTLFALVCAGLAGLNAAGDDMDATKIKELARQIDDALIEGQIYRIHYTVAERKTDAFYAHKKELITLLQDAIQKDEANPAMNQQAPDFVASQQTRRDMIAGMEKDLKQFRERHFTCDYSMDGTGFYLQQSLFHMSPEGKVGTPRTTTYVSDGKIMGTFYKEDSQGVIEPATERPRTPLDNWTDIAYHFSHDTLSACVGAMPKLEIAQEAGALVISGERVFDGNEKTRLELRIDKATLTPLSGTLIFYDCFGKLHTEVQKTWQYQDFAGIRLPKTVIDQYSETDLSGKLNLEKERVFTIVDFTPTPTNSKNAFADLLKSNFSMYDEITGEHYISGSPSQVLDNLSK